MGIAVTGSGGVGGHFGTRLAEGGADVTSIPPAAHLAAMRKDGLRIESPLGGMPVATPEATDDPATIGPLDPVLFSVNL